MARSCIDVEPQTKFAAMVTVLNIFCEKLRPCAGYWDVLGLQAPHVTTFGGIRSHKEISGRVQALGLADSCTATATKLGTYSSIYLNAEQAIR